MKPDLSQLTIASARKHLDAGDFSAVDLAQASLDVIKQKDGDIHAFLEVFDDVLEQAARADEMIKAGKSQPLTGIPLALKDNMLIKGKRVSAGSKILEGYVAPHDSTLAVKLKEQGAVIVGRTNMDEFAMGSSTEQSAYGPTKNPLDTSRVPGGSSGGSAAAVTMNAVLGSFGSDTGGSIRQPAALCGIVGLKPTYGSVSRHGLIALGSSLDIIGPFAKTVEDTAMLFEATKGKDWHDTTTVDKTSHPSVTPSPKRIGVPRTFLEENKLADDVRADFDAALQHLADLGYELVDVELPNVHYSVPTYYVVLPAEASSNLARFDGIKYPSSPVGHEEQAGLIENYSKVRGAGFGPEPRRRIMIGTYVLSSGYYDAYYNRANVVRRAITKDFTDAWKQCDAVVTPTTAGPAFKMGEKMNDPVAMYLEDIFTVSSNLTGMPAISVPSGTVARDGVDLPLGLQIIAPHMGESVVFEIGKKFENK
ncbi:MAG: hypothetical protein RLY47_203 [Candidatus Parcubacteria bacterium]|jgi:aspartyl-tRNA(Asn)/glutamyl-tRNA(Gln) amidotransferase subunit A